MRYFTCWCEEPAFLPSDHEKLAEKKEDRSDAQLPRDGDRASENSSKPSSLRFVRGSVMRRTAELVDLDGTQDSGGVDFEWERDVTRSHAEKEQTQYSVALPRAERGTPNSL